MLPKQLTIPSFLLSFFVLGISATLLGTNNQNLAEHLHMPLENGGIFIALQGISSTMTMMLIGTAYSKYALRPLLLSGPIMLGIGCVLLGVADQQLVAFIGALILGLGFGAMLVGPTIIIPTLIEGKATRALNGLNIFFGIGAVIGPQVVNFALQLDDFRLSFLIAGVCNFVLVGAFMYITLPDRLHTSPVVGSLRQIIMNTSWGLILPFGIFLLLYVGTEVGFGAWIFTQLTEVAHADKQSATLSVSMFWGGLVIGRVIATILAGKLQASYLLLMTLIVMGSGAGLLLLVPESAFIATLSALIVGIGCGPVFGTTLAIVSDTYPATYATASGVIIAVGNLGAIVIPWLQGKVGGGESGGMIVTLVLAFIMIGMVFYLQKQIQRDSPPVLNPNVV